MKRFLKGLMVMALALVNFAGVKAETVTRDLEWKVGSNNEYGYASKVSDLVTTLKGAQEKDELNNAYTGPYTYNTSGKLADGITEEITVNIKLADLLNPNDAKVKQTGVLQGIFVTSVLFYDGQYKTEARVTTANENGKAYFYIDWHNQEKKYEITEDGLYTYRWNWYTENSKVYVKISLVKDNEEVYKSDAIDMTSKVSSSDTVSSEDLDKLSAGYVWFYGINLENGVDVYSKIPETIVKPEVNGSLGLDMDASTLNDIFQDSLKNFSELKELLAKEDVEVSLESKKIELAESNKKEFTNFDKNLNVSDFFDISILVKATDGDHYLKELTNKIKLAVEVPSNLPSVAKGLTRKYYILREHDGKIEKLDATLSKDGKTISFETDKFSTYAIAYSDVEENATNPNTTDNIMTTIMISAISLAAVVGTSLYLKKRNA